MGWESRLRESGLKPKPVPKPPPKPKKPLDPALVALLALAYGPHALRGFRKKP